MDGFCSILFFGAWRGALTLSLYLARMLRYFSVSLAKEEHGATSTERGRAPSSHPGLRVDLRSSDHTP